jgi:hypothetical protein
MRAIACCSAGAGAHRVGQRVLLVEHFIHDAVRPGHRHVLVQVAHADALVEGHRAGIGLFHTGDALQQGALPRPIAGHDGHLLPLGQTEGDIGEQLTRPVAFGQLLDGKQVHGEARRYRWGTAGTHRAAFLRWSAGSRARSIIFAP